MSRGRKAKKPEEPALEPVAKAGDVAAPTDAAIDASAHGADHVPADTVRVTDAAQSAEQGAEVNPFPRVIKTANFNGYKVRLMQDQADNEMQIRFGEGRRQDKPSDAVLT